jgi:hypothetical protein
MFENSIKNPEYDEGFNEGVKTAVDF